MPPCNDELMIQTEPITLSPGVVEGHEILVRYIYRREWVDRESGELLVTALQVNWINVAPGPSAGLSVDRRSHVEGAIIHQRLFDRCLAAKADGIQYLAEAVTSDVRSIIHPGDQSQALCVLDAAEEGNLAHAVIRTSVQRSRTSMLAVRDELLATFALQEVQPTPLDDQES